MSEKQMMTAMTWLAKLMFRAICGAMTAVMYQIHGDYAMSTNMLNSLLRMNEELDDFIDRIRSEWCGVSKTEVLRRMLDDRGVKWHNRDSESGHDDCLVFKTWWKGNLFYEESYPNGDSYTLLEARSVEHITPEQAVEATLGRGTCRMNESGLPVFNGYDDGYFSICSECGFVNYMRRAWLPIKFCPNCGRKVVDA